MAIINISGKANSGKDTVGKIIQAFTTKENMSGNTGQLGLDMLNNSDLCTHVLKEKSLWYGENTFEIRKWADKLKDMVCLLIGCTREQLEDEESKNKELGPEWDVQVWIDEHGREILYPIGHIRGTKRKMTPRKLLQLLGTECGREIIHPNIWINSLLSEYQSSNREGTLPNWIITDSRFPNDVEAVKAKKGYCIRVNSKRCDESIKHESEIALDNYTGWDYVIENDGTIEELVEKVKVILVELGLL